MSEPTFSVETRVVSGLARAVISVLPNGVVRVLMPALPGEASDE